MVHVNRRILILIALTAAATGAATATQAQILPQRLVDAAAEHECSEVADFYDQRPGGVNPPYVLNYLDDGRNEGAAFWCMRDGTAERYLLVILGSPNMCPDEISWMNPPGGLSMIRNGSMDLSRFFYRDNVGETGPANVLTAGPILRSEYDGAGAYFYCYEGCWLVSQFH